VLDRLPTAGPEAVLELNDTAVSYLSHVFDIYDSEHNGLLSAMDLEHMFNRAPIPIYQVGFRVSGLGVFRGLWGD
jgi:hypothetical protein